ncbi:uncharacterized protein LOC144496857 [Mustelus asterias]
MCDLFRLWLVLGCIMQVIKGQVKMKAYHAPGSSILFPGVPEDQQGLAEFFRWDVSSGSPEDGTTMGVLQFHAGNAEPSLMNKYKGRLDFFPSSGSFVLHNLTSSDEGLYTLSINLQIAVQTVQLRIIDELSKASILRNSSSLDSKIVLTCDVSGKPHAYQWQKDGGEISQHHQLITENRSLIIPNARKDDCGTYTCIARNPVSSIQTRYTLTIPGVPRAQFVIVTASVAGLILSSVSFIGLILICWLKTRPEIARKKYDKPFFWILLNSNILSLAATIISLASWIVIKGASSISVVALCFVFILFAFVLFATIAQWNLGCIKKFRGSKGFRASLDVSCIMSSFIVIAVSIVILVEEILQIDRGCQVVIMTWSILAPLMLLFVIIFSVFFAIWCYVKEDKNDGTRGQDEQQDDAENQHLNGTNLNRDVKQNDSSSLPMDTTSV